MANETANPFEDPYADPYSPKAIAYRPPTPDELFRGRMRASYRESYPGFEGINDSTPVWLEGPHKTPQNPDGWSRTDTSEFDKLMAYVNRTATPIPAWQSLPEPIPNQPLARVSPSDGSLIDAFTGGIMDNTIIGTVLRRQKAIAQVNAEMGWKDGMPEPGYDPFKDPQLADKHGEMWRFYDSKSPQETRLRILQLVQADERHRMLAANHHPLAGLAAMAGSAVDPTMLLPTVGGLTKVAQVSRGIKLGITPALRWGVAANAVEGAALNMSIAFAAQAFNATNDASEGMEGISDLLMLSGTIGAVGGALAGVANHSHVNEVIKTRRPDAFRPSNLRPSVELNVGNRTVGETHVDANGNKWEVRQEGEQKYFEMVEPYRPPKPGEAEPPKPGTPEHDLAKQAEADAIPSVLDTAPPSPLEAGDHSAARSLSAAVVPGMATSNFKNLLEAEAMAPAGGIEKLPTSPGARGLGSPALTTRQLTLRIVDGGGAKQNKNIASRMAERTTPPEVLRERAELEQRIAANQAVVSQGDAAIEAERMKPWSDGIVRLAPNKNVQLDPTGRPITPKGMDVRGSEALHHESGVKSKVAANYPAGQQVMDEYGVIWTVEQRSDGKNYFGQARTNEPFEPRALPGKPGILETDAQYAAREAAEQARLATPQPPKPAALAAAEGRKGSIEKLLELDKARLADEELALATGRVEPEKSSVSVESWFAVRWKSLMNAREQGVRGAWVEGRAALAGKPISEEDAAGVGKAFALQGRDLFGGLKPGELTFGQFRRRVTDALANDHVDPVRDAMSSSVEKASREADALIVALRDAADHPDVNLFRREAELAQQRLDERRQAYLDKQAKAGDPPHPAVIGQFDDLEKKLQKTIREGPHQSNSKRYVPSIYRMDKMAAMPGKFISIVEDWIVKSSTAAGSPVSQAEAHRSARAAYDKITHTKAQSLQEYADEALEEISNPGAVKARTLDIPRELIKDFLEDDIIMIMRYHGQQMGSAIEMTREFGDINMTRQLQSIADEYKGLIEKQGDVRKRADLIRRRDQDIADMETLRDRVLGIEGASKDPHSWSERTIRMLKHYTSWTTLGLSAISQMADFPRIVLTEGLDATFRYAFGSLLDASRKEIFKMVNSARLHSGDVMELSTASGSLAFANIGDTMHSRTAIERAANNLSGHYFLANGLTWVTDLTRTMAAVSILGNMNANIMRWGEALTSRTAFTDEKLMAKFRSLGMDGNDVLRMYNEIKANQSQFKSILMTDTNAWKDKGAQELYRAAFTKQMNVTVVTPGAFERPTFMSNSVGSLITQFKAFGVASYHRTLVTGLQDNDRQFWTGAATLVGAGIVLNEIRNQLFYGRSSFDQPYLGILVDGIDRSGVLGSVMDMNNAIETATHNKLGMRPLVGAPKTMPVTPEKMIGTFMGPSAEKVALSARLLGEVMSGDATARTWRESRGLVPGQNMPYTDWFFDMMYPKGTGGKKKAVPEATLPQEARI